MITNLSFSNLTGPAFNNTAAAMVSGSVFSGNTAFNGGAIVNSGTVTITNSSFSGNSAVGGNSLPAARLTISVP
jgi:hypothetical protein